MTRDRARKKAIRARMAAGGEPYSVAARRVRVAGPASQSAVAGPAGPAVAADEIIARADRTLAAPGAWMELRIDTGWPERSARARPRPGPFGSLVRRAGRAAWERMAPGVDAASVREAFTHQAGAGFLEAAARRYQIDFGAYAQLYADGNGAWLSAVSCWSVSSCATVGTYGDPSSGNVASLVLPPSG